MADAFKNSHIALPARALAFDCWSGTLPASRLVWLLSSAEVSRDSEEPESALRKCSHHSPPNTETEKHNV